MDSQKNRRTAVRRFSVFAFLYFVCTNSKNVCRVLAIAALLQGWLLCGWFYVPCKCDAMCDGLLETLN